VEDPLPLIPDFAAAGADIITVHTESGRHVRRALQLIAEQKNTNDIHRGILRGIALNPGTPLEAAAPLLDEADIVFLLAVNPGFPKQRFIEATAGRFSELKTMTGNLPEKPLLGIDGGITRDTIAMAGSLGADIIVSGSAIFEGNRIQENFAFMMQCINHK
jgi:ribulose-phosphate 3-epimerase